ncbi:hypothetical protein CEE37_06420 [candidate division LCP-89 bacterium B3_LCP]|uniref:Uncharacterized protein n=1 Tax=candidate division LCP-89 bacterium B3_LCP TaxID=2012998 RepID=A0A532V263_UNCL8|nr:MAG: hypothetical protein CEE37_06420 [candidate division LCP-89 bacterium B3_LCP]
MKRIPFLAAAGMICLLLLAGTSSALLMDLSKEDLINNCEAIVQGTVSDIYSAWNSERTRIYTYATLTISDQFKGESVSSEIVIQIPGGTADDVTLTVSDTPTLELGMDIIIHTFTKETGHTWIYGWEKGVLGVVNGYIPEYKMTIEQFRQLVENTVH